MPSETIRKISAILFADIVGYTALMQKDEKAAVIILDRFKKEIESRVRNHKGSVIDFYGDGVLCTFQNSLEAVRCAMDIQKEFQLTPKIPLRIGIHSGPVLTKDHKIYGDSVNITARIESMGIPNSILLSERVKEDLQNQPSLPVKSLGTFEFKHVKKPIEVFALAREEFLVPNRLSLVGKFKNKTAPPLSKWLFPLLFILCLFGLALFWFMPTKKPSTVQVAPAIAVLPFRDMSIHQDQTYFSEGIAEEILNILAGLKSLKVVSRTSSFSFKDKDLTVRELGELLKVDYVLEGSVRKQQDELRITAQLINANNDSHVWSHTYNRKLENIFAVQDDVAQKIQAVLLEKIVPKDSIFTNNRGTQNTEAYAYFLKAKHIHLNKYYGNYALEDFNTSEKLFLKSIELDTNYALAYAGLADLYDSHKDALTDPTELRHYETLKIKYSELAWQLNPNLSYVNIVRGWITRNKKIEPADLDIAYESFFKGYQLNPNNSDGLFGLAYLYEDKSLIEDAVFLMDQAIQLEPLRTSHYITKGDFLMRAGHIKAAHQAFVKAIEMDDKNVYARSQFAMKEAIAGNNKSALTNYHKIQQLDSTFMANRVIHNKIFHFLIKETEKARNIPLSSLDYRGENVILNSLIGDAEEVEKNFLQWWDWWISFKGEKVIAQSSSYIELSQNPIYKSIRKKDWFRKLMAEEKEKYDRFYTQFPRAEQLLVQTEEASLTPPPLESSWARFRSPLAMLLLFFTSLFGFLSWFPWWRKKEMKVVEQTFFEEMSAPPTMEDPFLVKLHEILDLNIDNPDFTLVHISKQLNYSRSQFYRKVKDSTDLPPSIYIRKIRLQKAKQLLTTTNLSVSEVAYKVGFKDISYFSNCFSEEFDVPPSKIRDR